MDARIQASAARNAELLRMIAQTEHAVPAFKDQERLLEDLNQQLGASVQHIKELDGRREAELKDHEKYRDSVTRRLLHKAVGRGAVFDDKAAKEEREYHEALEASCREQQVADALRQRIEEASRARDALETEIAAHRSAHRELNEFYADIFADQRPGQFPDADELSRQSDVALQDYHNVREQIETLQNVSRILGEAAAKVPVADKQMRLALDHGHLGLLIEANTGITDAEALAKQAQDLSGGVVGPLHKVRKTWANVYSAAYSGDVLTSFTMHDEVKISQRELKRFGTAVEGYIREVGVTVESLAPQLRGREDELERTSLALQRERQRIIEGVLRDQKV